MKKKLGWILGIGIGVVLFIIGWRQINGSGGGDSSRQYTSVTNEFYYNQLTDHSYADAIAVEYCDETTEPDIVGIYVQIITEEDSDVLDYSMNFWEEENMRVDEDAFLPRITTTGMTQETYEQMQKEMNQAKTNVIAKIPEGADQREIIRYLSRWIQINLAYNDDFRSELETGTVSMEALQKYRIRSGEQCLLDKKAVQIDGKTYYTDPTFDLFGQMYSGLYTGEELTNLGKTMGVNYIFEAFL